MPDLHSYQVFEVRFTLAMQDPDMQGTGTGYHTVIFVETNADGPGSGTKHHVTGDTVNGMSYESNAAEPPENTEGLHSKERVGYTEAPGYPDTWGRVLKAEPAPPKQKAFNSRTMKTEPVKAWNPLSFCAPVEPREPLVKCTKWIERQAIPALAKHVLLQPSPS